MAGEIKRTFLGWDASLTAKVRDYLLQDISELGGKAPDLEGTLVIVPTRQAGRRLREALAVSCAEHGTALLSAQIVPSSYLFQTGMENTDTADSALILAVWVNVLMQKDLSALNTLFPTLEDDRIFQWALNTGEILQKLRDELSDGALTIAGVVDGYGENLEELDRWQNMAELELYYLEEMRKTGKHDPCLAKIEAAKSARLDESIERVVVAGVPDPSLLSIAALETIAASGTDIELLIHADPEMASAFDRWGRPLHEYWKKHNIDIPVWDRKVVLEAKPLDQAKRVVQEIADNQDEYEAGEIAVGVPDRSVIPFLEKTLGAEGLDPFDPADQLVGDHQIGLLALCMFDLLQNRSYHSVAAILRNPDFLKYLENGSELDARKILSELDEFQNYYLPVSLQSMIGKFRENPKGTDSWRDDFTELGKALAVVQDTIKIFDNSDYEGAWRSFFQRVYEHRILKPGDVHDSEFENAAVMIDRVLREFRSLGSIEGSYTTLQLSSLFVSALRSRLYHRERRDEILDLEGWLELPWNNRPFLVVTGMNEEFVPGGSLSDVFLPDSLREILKLRDDSSRFARDLFLMQSLIKSREEGGHVLFIAGKTANSGEPLKPSRLFFRCEDSLLPERVSKLLAEAQSAKSNSYPKVIFQLDPAKSERARSAGEVNYLPVTGLKDYLICPFRFYLKRVLGMEQRDDSKAGLDDMDFGNIVHEVLQEMGMDKDLWSCSDAAKLGEALAGIAEEKVVARFGKPPSPYVVVSLVAAQERLRAAAKEQVRLFSEGWEIINVETGQGAAGREKDRWRLRRNGFTVSGIIDRIDRNSKDGRVRIIDYKTFDSDGKSPESEHLAKGTDLIPEYNIADLTVRSRGKEKLVSSRWIDLQLPVYSMIYNQNTQYNENLELAYFILPKVVSKTGVRVWHEFDSERMEFSVQCLDGILASIKDQVFWPPAEKLKYDDFEDLLRFPDSVKEI